MACDPSAQVRRSVVKVIGATRQTLPYVLKRTKDADETVRKAAFKYVAEKVKLVKNQTLAFIVIVTLLFSLDPHQVSHHRPERAGAPEGTQ